MAQVLQAFREGQESFRQLLINAYGCCAVTGTTEHAVLEAAHITPYRGKHSNVIPNGLPMRRDIHRLFDRHLLTVDLDGVIRVAPTVSEPLYRALDGVPLRQPHSERHRAHPDYLARQREKCRSWLVQGA